MRTSNHENFDFCSEGTAQVNKSALKFVTLFRSLSVFVFQVQA